MDRKNLWIAAGILVIAVVALLFFILNADSQAGATLEMEIAERELVPSGETIETVFACPDGETFTTSYDLGSNAVTLTLADGSEHTLAQSVSAAGGRYTNPSESVVFSEGAGAASVQREGETIHEQCVAQGVDLDV